MKRLFAIAILAFFFGVATAQSTDKSNIGPDSTRHQFSRHNGYRNGIDQPNRQNRHQDEAMNGFGDRYHNRHFRSHGTNRFTWAHNRIHFTPAQRQQLKTINQQFKEKREDVYKQDNLTLREYKSRLIGLEKDRKAQLKNLLTPEQQTAMEKMKKQVQDEMQIKAVANLERLKIKLNLTEEQTSRIKSQQSDFRTQMMAIHQNDNLLSYQKKDLMKALLVKRQDAIKSVLTPEQVSQFEKMHRQGFGGRFERNNVN